VVTETIRGFAATEKGPEGISKRGMVQLVTSMAMLETASSEASASIDYLNGGMTLFDPVRYNERRLDELCKGNVAAEVRRIEAKQSKLSASERRFVMGMWNA